MEENTPVLAKVLDGLEKHYGVQKEVGPSDPYEMIVFVNSGYPASDAACTKGYAALKSEVGTKPEQILKAPKAKLVKLMKLGGIVPEVRAERLKLTARMVNQLFGGELKWALGKMMTEEKTPAEKRLRRVRSALKEFPVIGEPSADKILLFAGLTPVAAVPSANPAPLQRILFGREDKNYGAGYRAAQEAIGAELDENFEERRRAYLLLKKHGQEICKRTKPKCEICPINKMCVYFQEGRGGAA